jgi:outer membrane protein assembly factor BamB
MVYSKVPVLLAARRIRITKGSRLSRPVFGGDGVFLVDRDSCTKLSRESLELLWRVPIERDSGLGFVQGRALVLGRSGAFYALDVSDGTRMWGPTRLGA